MTRGILFLLVILGAQSVRAETVVVMGEPSAELDTALRVVMAGRGVAVTGAPGPLGALRLERAAVAQRTAMENGAHAAVWIDDADVCAVTADGQQFRHAPMPPEAASPRAFAAIATSLLDEMIRPEAWAVDVNVNVNITPGVGAVPPPGLSAPGVAAIAPAPIKRVRTLVELGPILTPLTIGGQAAVLFPLSPVWRLGASLSIHKTFDSHKTFDEGDVYVLGVAALELRHVGKGRKHWDLGTEVGYVTDTFDPVIFVGFRIARTWELPRTALSLALTPLLGIALGGEMMPFPGIYSSLRWQVPL